MSNVTYEIVTKNATYERMDDLAAKDIARQMRKSRESFTMYRIEVAPNGKSVRTQLGSDAVTNKRGRPPGSKNKPKE